jgi:hypothetical protein
MFQYMARMCLKTVTENSHRIFSEKLIQIKLNCEWFFGFALLEVHRLYATVSYVS